MTATGEPFETKIAVRSPEQQGEECRRAYEETRPTPRRITAEPPGWEDTRALHECHIASKRPQP